MSAQTPAELERIYRERFTNTKEYRERVWRVLVPEFFQRFVPANARVLDLGCGYGEFIGNVRCGEKLAMDLNPAARAHLASDVRFLEQDCSTRWELPDATLDVIFTSNFFEHLPSKEALARTLAEATRALRPGGRLIAMGPNIRVVQGSYWDFWDHHLPLSDRSLAEALRLAGLEVKSSWPGFLPYTLVGAPSYPDWMVRLYLRLPFLWPIFGGQFLIMARKP